MENRIKVSELRLGNLIKFTDAPTLYSGYHNQVVELDFDNLKDICFPTNETKDWYEPIPLSEDWLIRFGFKDTKHFGWWSINYMALESEDFLETVYCTHEVMISINPKTNKCSIENKSEDDAGANTKSDIKYVHQLQNLYFALTGTELNLISKPAQSGENMKG